uniref:Uncharacterized protein n=1 Tax=Asparagus officinalis TaxID=4686 RepID=Q2XNU0_ASPOF|nr:hypothetical protein 12.t00050 [Asparagus officinalis]
MTRSGLDIASNSTLVVNLTGSCNITEYGVLWVIFVVLFVGVGYLCLVAANAIGAAFELCLAAIGAAFELCLAAIGAAFELCLAAIGAAFELIVEAAGIMRPPPVLSSLVGPPPASLFLVGPPPASLFLVGPPSASLFLARPPPMLCSSTSESYLLGYQCCDGWTRLADSTKSILNDFVYLLGVDHEHFPSLSYARRCIVGGECGIRIREFAIGMDSFMDSRNTQASRVQTRSKSTTGKRALGPVEEGKYDKRARRKLTLEPSASKLMSDAQKAWHTEEEEQESTAMELSPQPGLPTVGPALGGHDSSAYSLHEEERGDESFAGGAEFVPEDTLHDTSSTASHVAEDIAPAQEPLEAAQQGLATDKSPSASVLLPIVGDSQPSPTTGIIAKPTVVEDAPAFPPVGEEEPMDHSDGAGATDDEGDPSGNEGSNDNLGDDSDDLDDWDIPPPSFSDKASAYVPLPLTDPMIHEASTVTPPPAQQLMPPLAQVSEPPHLEIATTALPPTTLLTISLASTEVVDVPRSSQMGGLMALQSSPSQLDINIPSQTNTPKSHAGLLLGSVSTEVFVPSPIAVSSPMDVPDFLKISLDYLESLTKKVIAHNFILVRLLEYAQFKLLRYWSMVVPSVGITGPTMKVDSSACVDLILKLLDAQVTRPTSGAGASMTRTYRIFGKFSAINGFDEPLPTTV